jgi:prepilin-type processing-associated H-X9-DG protein
MQPLVDYYRATNVLRCPSMSQFYQQSPYSYFMGSRAVFVETATFGSVSFRRMSFPSQYLLSGDTNFPFTTEDADPDNYSQDTLFGAPIPAHLGRVNILFGDLHAGAYGKFDAGAMTYSFDAAGVPF